MRANRSVCERRSPAPVYIHFADCATTVSDQPNSIIRPALTSWADTLQDGIRQDLAAARLQIEVAERSVQAGQPEGTLASLAITKVLLESAADRLGLMETEVRNIVAYRNLQQAHSVARDTTP